MRQENSTRRASAPRSSSKTGDKNLMAYIVTSRTGCASQSRAMSYEDESIFGKSCTVHEYHDPPVNFTHLTHLFLLSIALLHRGLAPTAFLVVGRKMPAIALHCY